MANPRKFSEKIALQKQKQAEGTAEFERIMREVSDATSKNNDICLRSADCNAENVPKNITDRDCRARSVGVGPMRRPSDRKLDRSPYSSGNAAYLSPPNDSGWRRASSDSAIHQSILQNTNKSCSSHSPINTIEIPQCRSSNLDHNADYRYYSSSYSNQNSPSIESRHKYPMGLTRLLGTNVYQSTHEHSLVAPTGSLPDLTSVHFSTPINIPRERNHEHSSSPFSSSPITTSPTAFSPTLQTRYQYSPANSPSEKNLFSPTHYILDSKQEIQQKYSPKQGIGNTASHLSFTNLSALIPDEQKNDKTEASHSCNDLSAIGMVTSNLTEYRNSECRPSPNVSPGVLPLSYSNDSNRSAPNSPAPYHGTNSNNQSFDTFQEGYHIAQFQNNFEQFSLVDNSSPASTTASSMQSSHGAYSIQLAEFSIEQERQSECNVEKAGQNLNCEMLVQRQNLFSKISHESDKLQNRLDQFNYPEPNTPTSIPEIVFSDFSTGNDFSREIFGSLDLELGPIDNTGFQMNADPHTALANSDQSYRKDTK